MGILLLVCLMGIVYIFFGYPVILTFLAKICPEPVKKEEIYPSVTIIIPAHNEEKVLEAKIRNALEQDYPADKLQVICASDGSIDRTVEIAKALLPDNMVLDIPDRQGKTNIINKATAHATGEIIVYTDANITLAPDCVQKLVQNFADPSVGCVAGQLTHVNPGESLTAASVGLYWRYEENIKKQESLSGSIMGADGGIFSIRRELFRPLPLFIIDDYATSMGILTRGYRVVFETAAKAYERASTRSEQELKRKVRIATRAVSASLFLKRDLKKMGPLNLFKFVSHRVLRYLAFYLMVISLLLNVVVVSLGTGLFFKGLLVLQCLFYCIGFGGLPLMNQKPTGLLKIVRLISYFIAANYSACLGATKAILGRRVQFWESPDSAR